MVGFTEAVFNLRAVAGETVTLYCPTSGIYNRSIVWWRRNDLITLNSDVRPELKRCFSYNRESGNLTIFEAKNSALYQCGVKFGNQKHLINFTVTGKCLFLF